jgi:transposase-like protein
MRLSLWKRLFFSAVMTVVLFGLLELGLAVFTSITPFRPFRLVSTDPAAGTRAYAFAFNSKVKPIVMPKPRGTFRIFCLGASATKGTPFIGAGFPEFMQAIFAFERPGRVEVVNLGADGFTSGLVAEVFRDALALNPDLCIIDTGDNELLGFSRVNRKAWPRLNRAVWWVARHSRVAQLPMAVIGSIAVPAAVIPMFAQLPRVERTFDRWLYPPEKKQFVRELYIENIDAMVKLARPAGVQVVLAAAGSNLRDWIRLKSVHAGNLTPAEKQEVEDTIAEARAELRQGKIAEARALLAPEKSRDPHDAKLLFFLGRAELGLGERTAATHDLEQAVENADFFQQSPPSQNRRLLEYARRQQVPVLDVDTYLRSLEPDGLPGFDHFLDGCHPDLETHYLIARKFCDLINDLQLGPAPPAPRPDFEQARGQVPLSPAAAAGHLLGGFARYDGIHLDLKAAGPDEKVQIYRATLSQKRQASPRPEECRYHLIWDEGRKKFVAF